MPVNSQSTPRMIETGVVYHLDEFMSRVGWSRHAIRTARRKGLKVVRTAGRAYVRGDDFLEYLDRACSSE